MTHSRDIAARLVRTIIGGLGTGATLLGADEREWASATFSGARHRIDLMIRLPSSDAPPPSFLTELPEWEFDLPGEIVADCSVILAQRERSGDAGWQLPCRVELLTITAE
jgi:hypothetical protein